MTVPDRPKIYHITHVNNLPQMISAGFIWSDAERLRQGLTCHVVGMSAIKARRLQELSVACHHGTMVGEYTPFYFCPRSIMLYILHKGNHPDLQYKEGQRPIIHLQADLEQTIGWANRESVQWAFTDRNAGARIAQFFDSWKDLDKLHWPSVRASDFTDAFTKEYKQAEFLFYKGFPWELVEKIGVIDSAIAQQVESTLADVPQCPHVRVERGWYY